MKQVVLVILKPLGLGSEEHKEIEIQEALDGV